MKEISLKQVWDDKNKLNKYTICLDGELTHIIFDRIAILQAVMIHGDFIYEEFIEITLVELEKYFINEQEIENYREFMKKFIDDMKVDVITSEDIEQWEN